MEILDILNEKGEKTGLTKLKKEVHVDGDWHRTVHVWFVNPMGVGWKRRPYVTPR